MGNWRAAAAGAFIGTGFALLDAAAAFADNCSSELDCQQTQTYNTTTTVIGTAIAVATAVISILVSQASSAGATAAGTAAAGGTLPPPEEPTPPAEPPPPPMTDPPTSAGMNAALTGSALGQDAEKYIKDHNISVVFTTSGGSYWDAANNRIVINASDNQDAGQILVHEVNHAENNTSSNSAWNSGSKTTYVDTMINQETQGTVESIQSNQQLRDAGKTPPHTFPLENEYNAARTKGMQDYQAAHPGADPADVTKAGDDAGYARVKVGFENGEVKASTNGQSYKDYYGNSYDRSHPAPPGGP